MRGNHAIEKATREQKIEFLRENRAVWENKWLSNRRRRLIVQSMKSAGLFAPTTTEWDVGLDSLIEEITGPRVDSIGAECRFEFTLKLSRQVLEELDLLVETGHFGYSEEDAAERVLCDALMGIFRHRLADMDREK